MGEATVRKSPWLCLVMHRGLLSNNSLHCTALGGEGVSGNGSSKCGIKGSPRGIFSSPTPVHLSV